MTQIPAGWYPDPAAPQGAPPGHRFWDGTIWTGHVLAPAGPAKVATTPDGQPLADWWPRLGASLIDSFVLVPLMVLAAWPWLSEVFSAFGVLFEETMRASETGAAPPSQADFDSSLIVLMLPIALVSTALSLAYNAGFLRWKQATPGKLAIGLRVRLRDRPGTMPWSTILVRWLTQNWAGFFSMVPVVGRALGAYPMVDCLWPLWDSKNQALHDKAARTNVVVHRP